MSASVSLSATTGALSRDRITWMVYLQLGVYGYFLYAFAPSVTLLRDDEHISSAISGLHGTAFAIGGVIAGLICTRLVHRFGRGLVMWMSLALLCVGISVFVSCRIVEWTIAGALISGLAGALVVNMSASSLTAHHHGAAGGTAVTEANGFASGAGIFAPLLIGLFVGVGLGWRAGVLVTLLLIAVVAVIFGRSVPLDALGVASTQRQQNQRLPVEYWRAWAVLVMTTATEFSMTIWSSDVLRHHDGLSKGIAATGVTAIVAGMTLGRLGSGRLVLRYGLGALLLVAFAVTLVGFTIFWTASVGWLAFIGLFVTGLGISLHFPLGITRAIGFSQGHPDQATSYIALGNGMAIALAPFGLGAFADHVGSHTAILVVPVFVILAAIGVATGRRTPTPAGEIAMSLAVGDIPAIAD